jgi:hypothetical protein
MRNFDRFTRPPANTTASPARQSPGTRNSPWKQEQPMGSGLYFKYSPDGDFREKSFNSDAPQWHAMCGIEGVLAY